MGWERKRGKIEEFNRLLRGDTKTSYTVQIGDLSVLPKVRYCITLGSDTRLPRDTAKKLIGVILHPLHHARFDPSIGRVTEGYDPPAPRSVTLRGPGLAACGSGRHTGVDPYTTAVSNTYQDLFNEGIFTGKGLYDVDAFTAVLEGTVPENLILSHDLLEGVYARTALVSDVEVVDDYPPDVLTHTHRQHRGWGIGRSSCGSSPVPARQSSSAIPSPRIGRWKISTTPAQLTIPFLLLLASAWTILPNPPWVWTVAALVLVGFGIARAFTGLLHWPAAQPFLVFLRINGEEIGTAFAQGLVAIAFLPYHAWRMAHAIGVTLIRLFWTRRGLLEWVTAARTATTFRESDLGRFIVEMGASPALAAGVLALVALVRPAALGVAIPFIVLWSGAPVLAYVLSQPLERRRFELDREDRASLRRLARKTWRYFETFLGPEDHWLPPDNYQETPVENLAHRTSPTNIGLSMLSTLAASRLPSD
jgi:cyclic beta-1,2-glucan synthetase